MAITESLNTFKTGNEEFDRFQSNIQRYTGQINDVPLLNGLLVDVEVGTSEKDFAHKLGRQPQGFIVVDQTANSVIWRVSWNKDFIRLRGSANVAAKLWVF